VGGPGKGQDDGRRDDDHDGSAHGSSFLRPDSDRSCTRGPHRPPLRLPPRRQRHRAQGLPAATLRPRCLPR
jgi:hypothetical protein